MKKGFTLAEVIIVIAVIGVLAAILIVVLPKVIDSAKERSAQSSARSAVVSCNELFESASTDDIVILVNKASRYYLYGFTVSEGKLNPSSGNPYNGDSYSDVFDTLLSNRTICESSYSPQEITQTVGNITSDVRIFHGYKLCDGSEVSPYKLYMLTGDQKTVSVGNAANVTWYSDDETVATVDSLGNVTAKADGTASIYAKIGSETSKPCTVYVTTTTEVSSIAELKNAVESDSPLAYIRLSDCIQESDLPELFPITVPKGKFVSIDMNNFYINYTYTSAENVIESFLINDGGELHISSNPDAAYPYSRLDAAIHVMPSEAVSEIECDITLITNKNGGMYVSDFVQYFVTVNDEYRGESVTVIENESGTMYIRDSMVSVFIQGSDAVLANSVNCTAVYNGAGAAIFTESDNLDDVAQYMVPRGYSIVNNGVMPVISSYKFTSHCAINNSGTIGTIRDCVFLTNSNETENAVICIKNGGTIKSISQSEFAKSVATDTTDLSNSIAVYVEDGGTLGTLTDIQSYVGKTVLFEGQAVKCIESGRFYFEPNEDIINADSTVNYDDESKMYVVTKSKD